MSTDVPLAELIDFLEATRTREERKMLGIRLRRHCICVTHLKKETLGGAEGRGKMSVDDVEVSEEILRCLDQSLEYILGQTLVS